MTIIVAKHYDSNIISSEIFKNRITITFGNTFYGVVYSTTPYKRYESFMIVSVVKECQGLQQKQKHLKKKY